MTVKISIRPNGPLIVEGEVEIDPRPAGRVSVVERDGTVRDRRTMMPMVDPFTRRLILGLCVHSEGYLIGRDDAVRMSEALPHLLREVRRERRQQQDQRNRSEQHEQRPTGRLRDQPVIEAVDDHAPPLVGLGELLREPRGGAWGGGRTGDAQWISVVGAADVPEYLGPPRFHHEVSFRVSRPGVATGVAWTETGGDVLFVEARLLPSGHHDVILTGQPGSVMQESARAAVSHIRAQAVELGIAPEFLDKYDLHIHVPAGAIPKDGPSAGVTMTTALASELTGRPVRGDLAMTGEITLSGRVLPVGGIKEKVLAARRVGIREVILPKQNAKNVNEDLTPELRKDLTVHLVSTIDEVLALALQPVSSDTRPQKSPPKEPKTRSPLAARH